ncbi:hypothetical protein BT67DRAFT_444017 [Trichocladium antarcticum]|uniref:C3H1-type domain-containing protein n=1 Tax=Trichocladium antarcticum TaxID=1450529 RepID=A0AAN6UFP2_9PEZI|nr:hypothetical protein BT67DRAFT_444017 [Trichocladium antarcticum]
MTVCRYYQQGHCRFGSTTVAFSPSLACAFRSEGDRCATPMGALESVPANDGPPRFKHTHLPNR